MWVDPTMPKLEKIVCNLLTIVCAHIPNIYVRYCFCVYFPDMAVSDPFLLGSDFSVNGKEKITVRNLLLHNAGFPPDPQVNYCKREVGVRWLNLVFLQRVLTCI